MAWGWSRRCAATCLARSISWWTRRSCAAACPIRTSGSRHALDALCAVAVKHRAEAAPRWIDELEAVTARRGIRELLLRAIVYRARLGALDAARSLAAQIDNPALDELLAVEELSTDAA